jgi:hypothetical protein
VQNAIFVTSDFTPLSPVEQAGAVVSSREYWKRTANNSVPPIEIPHAMLITGFTYSIADLYHHR